MKQTIITFFATALVAVILHFAFPTVKTNTVPNPVKDVEYVPQPPIVVPDLVTEAKLGALQAKYKKLVASFPKEVDVQKLQDEANEYWKKYYKEHPEEQDEGYYSASTVVEDSSKTFTAEVSYISRVPLHQSGFFRTSLTYNPPPQISNTVYVEKPSSLLDNFSLVIGTGCTYAPKYKEFLFGYFVGTAYRLHF